MRNISVPFRLGEDGRLLEIMKESGVPSSEVSSYNGRGRFPSLEDFVTTEIKSWVLADSVDEKNLADVVADAQVELAGFCGEDGSVDLPLDAIIAKATKRNAL